MKRILLPDDPSKYYRRTRKSRHKNKLFHWGQKKLLYGEIEFLHEHGDKSNIVVYAGAAPGIHITYLAKLFPHKFILYDPAPFKIEPHERIETHNCLFTDKIAAQYKSVLFISDIRSGNYEEPVPRDMAMQMRWCNIIKPAMAMLKFRLPYSPGLTKYFAGEIRLQCYAPLTSTETRLITDCKKTCTYDNTVYERQMFYFNTQIRTQDYDRKCEQYILSKVNGNINEIDMLLGKNYIKMKYPPKLYTKKKIWNYIHAEVLRENNNK